MGHPRGRCAVELPRLGLAGVLGTCKRECGCCYETASVRQQEGHCVMQGKHLLAEGTLTTVFVDRQQHMLAEEPY